MTAPSGPMAPELKCVSGFCLPRGYKKLETPITEGKYRKSTTSHNSILLLLVVSNHNYRFGPIQKSFGSIKKKKIGLFKTILDLQKDKELIL